jgi:hypothetical protein
MISDIRIFLGSKYPVSQSIIVSLRPPSLTQITGFHADIDSSGLIQKSSSIGIYILAIQFPIYSVNPLFSGSVTKVMFLYHLAMSKTLFF